MKKTFGLVDFNDFYMKKWASRIDELKEEFEIVEDAFNLKKERKEPLDMYFILMLGKELNDMLELIKWASEKEKKPALIFLTLVPEWKEVREAFRYAYMFNVKMSYLGCYETITLKEVASNFEPKKVSL